MTIPLSNRNNKRAGSHNANGTHRSDQKLWVRILALFLAALMILSVAYLAILFIISAFAADESLSRYAMTSSIDSRNLYVSAGVRYGSSVAVSHGISSPYGFVIGEAVITRSADRSFTPIYQLNETEVSVACDNNLKGAYRSVSFAPSEAETDIGAYHVELTKGSGNAWDDLSALSTKYVTKYGYVFPAYVNGSRSIRIGAFATYSEANSAAAAIGNDTSEYTITVASPSNNGVCILNGDCDDILFEFVSDTENHIGGLCAVQNPDAEYSFLCHTATSYLYDGMFCFRRYISTDYNGLTLINLVSLYRYIEGVLPSEIPNTWPIECQKAFAITVCAYTVSNLGKRFSTYGFDLCCSSGDQNYFGRRKVTEVCSEGAKAVDNLALCFEKSLISGYYSSSQGGCSVDTQYVWGGNTGTYICSQPTPWEDYSNKVVNRGMWFSEVSATELCTLLKKAGYSLSGTSISSVSYELTGDSSYIYSLTATDNKGKSATITKCSKVNSAMGSYTKSANFVIGKGSVNYSYDEVLDVKIIDLTNTYAGSLNVYTGNGSVLADSNKFNFFTETGIATSDKSSALYVNTDKGNAVLSADIDIPVSTTPDENGIYTYVSDYGTFLIVTKLKEHHAVYKASSASSFAIVGKGNGHGVGMSQYGSYFLAMAGATYDQILQAYYPGTKIINIFDYWTQG